MKNVLGALVAIALVVGLSAVGIAASKGIKCQLPGGKSCVCDAASSDKCKDKYKDVFSCVPNQDVSGLKSCESK